MKGLFSAPLRVYLFLLGFVLLGLYCGMGLPISLFPNSSKPVIEVYIGYGNATAAEFIQTYGTDIESQLRNISSENLRVEEVRSRYERNQVTYEVEFEWGDSNLDAEREVNTLIQGYAGRFSPEMRNSVNTWFGGSSGFLSVSFKSNVRTLDQIYDQIDRIVIPQITHIPDADAPNS